MPDDSNKLTPPAPEPAVGTDHVLVKVIGSDIACAVYRRFSDGSAGYYANKVYARAAGKDERTITIPDCLLGCGA